jgi:hypothetical protein
MGSNIITPDDSGAVEVKYKIIATTKRIIPYIRSYRLGEHITGRIKPESLSVAYDWENMPAPPTHMI